MKTEKGKGPRLTVPAREFMEAKRRAMPKNDWPAPSHTRSMVYEGGMPPMPAKLPVGVRVIEAGSHAAALASGGAYLGLHMKEPT